ncbi:pre-B-cell leukemia homeobox interacting protein 1b isoform X3 [Pseudoliparis swirei]|uniref:pre-B-cell leukemia homeobox interacting protein 1b isoform X3 n=1 Tax=Pseudoliparis swirei TaxID=2059687 RepID=UPI0024BE2321|nr:pre-B-cell leukemia homeobox interacting protein 1b isoform X3 [Pseudoliparis swirei]
MAHCAVCIPRMVPALVTSVPCQNLPQLVKSQGVGQSLSGAMSGGSSANSGTTLTPQETVAETLRPLAEGTEQHGESFTSAAGSEENRPAERLPVEGHLVSEETTEGLSGDTSTEQHTDASVPTSLDVSDSSVAGRDALSQSEGLPEGTTLSGPDPDSFSDSYSHITPSPDERPASLLTSETLGAVAFTQEEESLTQEGTQLPLNGEELQPRGEESDLFPKTTDLRKQADSLVDSEVGERRTEKTGEEAEPELRRRRSLLAVLERIGKTEEEEEEGEKEFQLPQREVDTGLSVNKCILGAVLLFGLGTIFFSESDYGTMELKDAQEPVKGEWLHPEVPPVPVDTDSSELLNKLAEGNQQIFVLQAQLQEQNEELKVATVQAEEGAQQQLQWKEMEKENSRLEKEMASLPVLQEDNERMKRELECVPALQKELETLRSTVTELKLPSASEAAPAAEERITSPPSGQPENSVQDSAGSTETQRKKPRDDQREKRKDVKKDTIDMDERKERNKSEWKEGEKRERKDGGATELKRGNHEQGKFDKEKDKDGKQKRHGDETKKWKEKEWKKEKSSRGEEGKPWKDQEENKDWIEKSERKEMKEEKDWKKANHDNPKDGKQWRSKEEKKDWKEGKDHGGKRKGKEEWKEEKEWKKEKGGFEESGKEKWEKKDSKKKELKKNDGDWKSRNGKDQSKEGKVKGERKQWEEEEHHGKEKNEKKRWNERRSKNDKDDEGWRKKDEKKRWNKNERRSENGKDDDEWRKKDEKIRWNKNERRSENGKDDDEWRKKDERKRWEKKDESWQKDNKPNGDRGKDRSRSQSHKDEHKRKVDRGHEEEKMWGGADHPHTHLDRPEYWDQQRRRLQHSPRAAPQCGSVEACARSEGLTPVASPEFEAVLQAYLAKAEEAGVEESVREELGALAGEFFRDGVFAHDQTSFREFAEDLGDILEDVAEADDEAEGEESDLENEMEEFEREVKKTFSVPGAGEKEWRKESGRGRG